MRGFERRRARDLQPPPVRVRERVRGLVPAVAHEPLAEERELLLGERSISRSSRRIRGVRKIDLSTPERVCAHVGTITFSLTVMFRKSRSVWNVRPTPRFAIACGGSPTSDSPSSRMSPVVGR